jgi:hypothetical protein
MVHTATRSIPIADVEHLAVITCRYPASTRVRRESPIPVVPLVRVFVVFVFDRIPIAGHPYVSWRCRWRSHVHDSRRWRRTDIDSNRHGRLSPHDRSTRQHERDDAHRYQTFHGNLSANLSNFQSADQIAKKGRYGPLTVVPGAQSWIPGCKCEAGEPQSVIRDSGVSDAGARAMTHHGRVYSVRRQPAAQFCACR